MSIQSREGSGQQVSHNLAYSKPFISTNGNPYYNPETYLHSYLNNYNKRTPMKPDNFIGFTSLRPDNMHPNRQHIPSALNPPITVPIMHTQPVPKVYH